MSLQIDDIEPPSTFGGLVQNFQLSQPPDKQTSWALTRELATRGFLLFRNQTLLADAIVNASGHFGVGRLAARHVVHAESPHEAVLRLSNLAQHGITGVGPQWHHDGSPERRPFSHVLFHAQRVPPKGGGTILSDLAAALNSLSPRQRDEWARLASINAYSGAVHPLVHRHPISDQPVLFMHLGQTGALIQWPTPACRRATASPFAAQVGGRPHALLEAMDPAATPPVGLGHRLLGAAEVRTTLGQLDALLSRHQRTVTYAENDVLVIDNLRVAHRATPSALDASHGLRIIHRTTVEGIHVLDPPMESEVPPFLYVWGDNPLGDGGLWQGSDYFGVGFRWNASLPMRN